MKSKPKKQIGNKPAMKEFRDKALPGMRWMEHVYQPYDSPPPKNPGQQKGGIKIK